MYKSFEVATPVNREELLDYLRPDLCNCLYMYLDIDIYEIGGGVINVWLQRGDDREIILVAMKYADSFQLYARDADVSRVNFDSLAALIRDYDAMRVSATQDLIKELERYFSDTYDASYGSVMEICKYRKMKLDDVVVEEATREDIPEIASIIQADEDLGQSYSVGELIRQFDSRYVSNAGKSFVIRVDGAIAAHLSFSVITDSYVIEAYTIVRPEFRNYPYGALLDSYVTNTVVPSMGKRAFAFMQEPRRIKLFEIMGNPVVGTYGKLIRRQDN